MKQASMAKVLPPTLRVGKMPLTTFPTDYNGAHGGAPSRITNHFCEPSTQLLNGKKH
jgi:hypothetical protein